MVTDLTKVIDASNQMLICLLDLSAAFEAVAVLAERLSKTCGICLAALDWLHSYLCNCRQTVLFNGVLSTVHSLPGGVPQSSILGPLLFLLYTADLGELASSLGLSSHSYTDDSQVYTWVDGDQQLYSSGVEWSLALNGSPNRLRSTSKRHTSCGVRLGDGVSISILVC